MRLVPALGIGALGTMGVVALSLGMNRAVEKRVTEPVTVVTTAVEAPKARPPATHHRDRAPAPRKTARAAPTPTALLAAGLSGLDFGLGDAADAALGGATTALVDQMGGAVMDEGAVEDPPRPTSRVPPQFPARARSLGQSGHVTLSFVVDVDGSVQDLAVVESDPPGVFDEAARAAIAQWSFEPGRQKGDPVAVRVRQTLQFRLE